MVGISGAQALVEALVAQGVSRIFGIPGAHTMAVYDVLTDRNDIMHITVRHEQGAGYMADGYARVTGEPGVALVTSGPAVTNIATAVAGAYADSVPILVIASCLPRSVDGRPGGQLHEMKDQFGVMEAVAGWSRKLAHVDQIPSAVADAFTYLRSERPRAAYIEVPLDIFADLTSSPISPRSAGPTTALRREDVTRVADLLSNSRRPLIVAGAGIQDHGEELRRLAERLAAPVMLGPKGKGILPDSHPLTISGRYLKTLPELADLTGESDLTLVIGSRLGAERTAKHTVPLGGTVIHIDVDPSEFGRNYPVDVAVHANGGDFMKALNAELAGREIATEDRRAQVAAAHDAYNRWTRHAYGEPVAFLDALQSVLRADDIVVADMTLLGYASPDLLNIDGKRRYIHTYEYCAIGSGFPTAIGAKAGAGDRDVIALCGDGGSLLTITELATAVQARLPSITVLFNDNAYTAVRREQNRAYPDRMVGTKLNAPDFVALAKSFGAAGVKAPTPAELAAEIENARGRDVPTLIEVPLPDEYAIKLWPEAWK